jgi:hypothetical protein
MPVILRCAIIDHIEGVVDTEKLGSSYHRLVFQDNSVVTVGSGINTNKLTEYLGRRDGMSIQERIRGQKVIYCMTFGQELRGVTLAEDWEGVEMEEGDFIIDRSCS